MQPLRADDNGNLLNHYAKWLDLDSQDSSLLVSPDFASGTLRQHQFCRDHTIPKTRQETMLIQRLELETISNIESSPLEETKSTKPHGDEEETESDSHHKASDQDAETETSSIVLSVENSEGDNEYDKDQDSLDTADEEYDEESDLDSAEDQENREQKTKNFVTKYWAIGTKEKQFGNDFFPRTQHLAPAEQLYTKFLG